MKKAVDSKKELAKLRLEIDGYDYAIVKTLAKRFECVERIGKLKLRHGLPIVQRKRWAEAMVDRYSLAEKLGVDEKLVTKVFALIQSEAIAIQKRLENKRNS